MPIYEFYCPRCNTIYNFFSKTINTEKIPFCPDCGDIPLERQMSVFATLTIGSKEEENDVPPVDESKMEKAMEMLAREAENINEDDPRQAAKMMRRLAETAGLNLNTEMEEALSRMEQGEDPEKIEEEMGDVFSDEMPFSFDSKKTRSKNRRPRIDETLYDL
ncbi:MAG: zinc ribbon domain-containing protein [Syntrophales bacterium]|jgi:putative FmdB family regulatory protein|nr:zinc ribbon domain-containing protein [Syntrophales bacterium]MDY0044219.1 zinc ribbon domain-containing protein [Syntrophales bacterium]